MSELHTTDITLTINGSEHALSVRHHWSLHVLRTFWPDRRETRMRPW